MQRKKAEKEEQDGGLVRSVIDGYTLGASVVCCGMQEKKGKNATQDEMEEDEVDDQEYALDLKVHKNESVLATTWSDMKVRVHDIRTGISQNEIACLERHSERINGLAFSDDVSDDKSLFSCAEDGRVIGWDLSTGKVAQELTLGKKSNFTSVSIGCGGQLIAVGDDNEDQSRITFWDRRSSKILGQYKQAHTDGITQLCFNPSRPTQLSSGSLDGLVCVFDITKPNEDDAMISVMNAQSPVNKLGYFGPNMECLFCLTSSETLALYHAEKASTMVAFTNIRSQLAESGVPSDYLVDCCYVEGPVGNGGKGQTLILVSGDHDGRMHLNDVTLFGTRPLCSVQNKFGHKSDIRSVSLFKRDTQSGVPLRMISAGEDGQICEWRHASTSRQNGDLVGASRRKKKSPLKMY